MSEKKYILIIDDDPDFLEATGRILSESGYEIITAASGKEGLDKFSEKEPDLVLCDMMMEGYETGAKVTMKIRENNIDVPIYLISSMGNEIEKYRKIDLLGFNGSFQKPVDPDELISTIEKALG